METRYIRDAIARLRQARVELALQIEAIADPHSVAHYWCMSCLELVKAALTHARSAADALPMTDEPDPRTRT